MQVPPEADGHDDYIVDYTATVGPTSRWANGYGVPFSYPDMAANDAKALTYTILPLESDVEVTGHPVVHLWVSSTAADGDFFVYLEEVDEDGVSSYITEGKLRASFPGTVAGRKTSNRCPRANRLNWYLTCSRRRTGSMPATASA